MRNSIFFSAVFILVVLSLVTSPVEAANTVSGFSATATTGAVATPSVNDDYHSIGTVELTITSDGSGDAVVTTGTVAGILQRVVYDVVDSASPTNNWDMIIKTADDFTVAGGTANNLSNTAASQEVPKIATVVSSATTHELWRLHDVLTFTGDNMGATKTVKVRLYLSEYK